MIALFLSDINLEERLEGLTTLFDVIQNDDLDDYHNR